jgi:hypothetical protein
MNISDHNIISVDIPNNEFVKDDEIKTKPIISWKKYSKQKLNELLNVADWNFLNATNCVTAKGKTLVDILKNSLAQLLNIVNRKLNRLKYDNIRASICFNTNKTSENWNLYKIIRNSYKNALRDTENRFIQTNI